MVAIRPRKKDRDRPYHKAEQSQEAERRNDTPALVEEDERKKQGEEDEFNLQFAIISLQ